MTETAVFSNVELTHPPGRRRASRSCTAPWRRRRSASTDRRVVHVAPSRIEAPNWLKDGKSLIFNSGGRIYRIPAAGGHARGHRHGIRHPVQQRSRHLARRHAAGDQRPVAGAGQVVDLHAAGRRRNAQARSRRPGRLTGTAGRRTARRWHFVESGRASSTSTRFLPRAARKPA